MSKIPYLNVCSTYLYARLSSVLVSFF
jgi:hypothetical protein